MITAHSGCDRTADNSIAFLHHALALPVDALEVDVRKNSGDVLILSHDETEEDAVSLAKAFALLAAHPSMRINCDLKQPGLEDAVVSLARQCGVADRLIFTGDANPALFRKGEAVYPQVVWYANLEAIDPDFPAWRDTATETALQQRLEQALLQLQAYETAGLNWHYPLAERVYEKAKALGIGISVWTVNDLEAQALWLNRQVENITSREITKLLALRDAKRE